MVKLFFNTEQGTSYAVQRHGFHARFIKSPDSRFNLMCLSIFIVATVVALVVLLQFFFTRIYAPHRVYVNERGAIVNETNGREVTLLLLNSNHKGSPFYNTGVILSKNDRFKIYYSGHAWNNDTLVHYCTEHNLSIQPVIHDATPEVALLSMEEIRQAYINGADNQYFQPIQAFDNTLGKWTTPWLQKHTKLFRNNQSAYLCLRMTPPEGERNMGDHFVIIERKIPSNKWYIFWTAILVMIVSGTTPCVKLLITKHKKKNENES